MAAPTILARFCWTNKCQRMTTSKECIDKLKLYTFFLLMLDSLKPVTDAEILVSTTRRTASSSTALEIPQRGFGSSYKTRGKLTKLLVGVVVRSRSVIVGSRFVLGVFRGFLMTFTTTCHEAINIEARQRSSRPTSHRIPAPRRRHTRPTAQ